MRLPRWTVALLRWLAPSEGIDDVLGDLEEVHRNRIARRGRTVGSLLTGLEALDMAAALLRTRMTGKGSAAAPAPTAGGRGRGSHRRRDPSSFLESVFEDVRHAARGMVRMPGVTLVALPTLALAVGATTALFSFADALVLRPLPVRDPDRLMALYHVSTDNPSSFGSFSYPDFLDLRRGLGTTGLEDVAAYGDIEVRLGEDPAAAPVEAAIVSASYFSVLGVRPLLGRTFLPEEDRTAGTHPVVILAQALWANRFGADPSLVGRTVTLDGRPFTVVGIAPSSTPSPDLHAAPQVWVPLMMHDVVLPSFSIMGIELFGNRGTQWLNLVGRLNSGATPARARDELRAFARRQAEVHPAAEGGWTIGAVPLAHARTGPPGASPLPRLTALIAAVVAMLLLIACANVANLLLARAVVRQREMAIRAAIGAGRARLVRQVLTEALLLAVVGGVAGVLLAVWAVNALPSLGITSGLPALHVRVDTRVLAVALTATVVAGLAAGLVPALRASTADVARAGKARAWSRDGSGARLPLHSLVTIQVAVSLVLLVGAGLTLRTLWNLYAIPLGFDAADVAVAQVNIPEPDHFDAGIPEAAPSQGVDERAWSRMIESVHSLPGVQRAALASIAPFASRRMAADFFRDERTDGAERGRLNIDMNVVSADYFATMGIRLLAGRCFTTDDGPGTVPVVIVNAALAARFWPGDNPLGRRIWMADPRDVDGPGDPLQVVGVVSDGRYYRAWRTASVRPFVFLPLSQHPERKMFLHVRAARSAIPTAARLRDVVRAAERTSEIGALQPVTEARAGAVALQWTSAKLLALFGLLAGTIAVIGIYGVVSFTVSRRTQEMGVRMALGAGASDVLRHVVAGSAVPILTGTAVGWALALVLSRYLSSLLYGVGVRDPVTFAAAGAGLAAVAFLASLVPARRATRVDPLTALRED